MSAPTAPDPADLVDLGRYPLGDTAALAPVVAAARAGLAADGVAELTGFLRPDAVERLCAEALELEPRGHHSVVQGTPYLGLPDPDVPAGDPRATLVDNALTAIAYDRFPAESPMRALYEWEPLRAFVESVLDRGTLHRYADPLGALNVAVMRSGDELGWHFDMTDFVVSIALRSSESGGDFESATRIRSDDDPALDRVAAVLAGDRDPVRTVAMEPGTLLLFEGRHSLHRVTPVAGERPRLVALLAYDTKPGTDSTELLKAVRYGRTAAEAVPSGSGAS